MIDSELISILISSTHATLTTRQRRQRLPKPRPTRSSRLLQATHEAQARRRAAQEEAARTGVPPGGPLWTMPRWRKAAAKVIHARGGGGPGIAAAAAPVAAV